MTNNDNSEQYRVTLKDESVGSYVGRLTVNNEIGVQLDGHIWFDRADVESVVKVQP